MSQQHTPIARLWDRHRLRVVDLAKAAGVAWPTAQSWLRGTTVPDLGDLKRIVTWLAAKGITPTLEDFVEVAA